MIITHAKDIDGVSPVILLKLMGREVDFYLLETNEVAERVPLLLEEDLDRYENIYITDLVLEEELYQWISCQEFVSKVHIFDHHISGKYAKDYSFATLDVDECATSLFYRYLQENGLFVFSPKVCEYVTHVFHLDLWYWKERGDLVAKKLGDLFEIYGNIEYIKHFVLNLQEDSLPILTIEDERLLEIEQNRIERYFKRKNEQLLVFRYQEYKMGVVFAESYRSELGMFLQEAHPELDFIAMIHIGGGVSLRTQRDDIDLSIIAHAFGGGGHKKASGFGVLEDQRIDIVKRLFTGAIEEKEK